MPCQWLLRLLTSLLPDSASLSAYSGYKTWRVSRPGSQAASATQAGTGSATTTSRIRFVQTHPHKHPEGTGDATKVSMVSLSPLKPNRERWAAIELANVAASSLSIDSGCSAATASAEVSASHSPPLKPEDEVTSLLGGLTISSSSISTSAAAGGDRAFCWMESGRMIFFVLPYSDLQDVVSHSSIVGSSNSSSFL